MQRIACALLLGLAFTAIAYAAPMPPRPVVNHQTRQCAVIVPGDECGDVILPSGWEYLDEASGETCPSDYATVELRPEWAHFKVPHCCTEGHSGVAGDCQDVVIHQSNQQCTFVEDIQKCDSLLIGWEAWSKNCPTNFEWVEAEVCVSNEANQTATPLLVKPSPTSLQPDSSGGKILSTPKPTAPTKIPNPLLPCLSPQLVLLAVLSVGIVKMKNLEKPHG